MSDHDWQTEAHEQYEVDDSGDYLGRFPRGTVARQSARKADVAGEAAGEVAPESSRGSGPLPRLPDLHVDPTYARQRAETLRVLMDFNPYDPELKSKETEAETYERQGYAIEHSNNLYSLFLPQARLANTSVTRYEDIATGQGYATVEDVPHADGFRTVSRASEAHLDRLADENNSAAGNIRQNKGLVSQAAAELSAAGVDLNGSTEQLISIVHERLAAAIADELQAKQNEKAKIEAKIQLYKSVLSVAGMALGWASKAASALAVSVENPAVLAKAEVLSDPNGMAAVSKSLSTASSQVTGTGGTALSLAEEFFNGSQLAMLDSQISELSRHEKAERETAHSAATEGISVKARASFTRFKNALNRYRDAIDSRRTQYASAGVRVDRDSKANIKHGGDKGAQTMLLISAGREAAISVKGALETNKTGNVKSGLGLDLNTLQARDHSDPNRPDHVSLKANYKTVGDWLEAATKLDVTLSATEEVFARILKGGGIKGDY